MKIYEQWQCPNCEHIEQVDVDDYLEIGTPMCVYCGGAVEMERLGERIAVEKGKRNYL
jgi:transcription elongation factor Elf1